MWLLPAGFRREETGSYGEEEPSEPVSSLVAQIAVSSSDRTHKEMDEMKKTILYVGGGILALGLWALSGEIGRFMGKSAMESYVQGRQEGAVEKAVELAVVELRKQLPMQFDEATTLQNVTSAGKTFYYYYYLLYPNAKKPD